MNSPARAASLGAALATALLAGCEAYAVRDADREVAEVLETLEREEIEARIPGLVKPVEIPDPVASAPAAEAGAASVPAVEAEGAETRPAPAAAAIRLGVKDAVRLAVRGSRDYRSQVEGLYLQALSLTGTRRRFSPQLSGTLSYLFDQTGTFAEGWEDGDSNPPVHTGALNLGVSQIVPLGGTFSLSAAESAIRDRLSDHPSYSASVSASYRQNLLRGVGYEATWEPLVQAERSMVYAAREFELYRQGFTIDVARRFYGLVSQYRQVENGRVRVESARRTLAQSEALYRVGQSTRLDLYRSQQDALETENAQLEAEQRLRDSLDQFKIFLGLPTDAVLEIAPDEPEFVPVNLDLVSAIAAAEANRLDYRTTRDQLEDAQRAVRIAAQGLRADLDLDVDASLASPATARFSDQNLTEGSVSAGLVLGLPFNRKSERNAYRSSLISLDRSRRSADLARDNLGLEVRQSLRDLHRARLTLDLKRRTIESEERRVRIATIQFRAGLESNREVVEAERGLLDAKNEEISQRVDYEIARLELRRILGTLLLDREGLWLEES